MSKIYHIEVLTGTTYTARIEAENIEEAIQIAEAFDPYEMGEGSEWVEGVADRTMLIGHENGETAFGFGIRL
jgi:hypothetical protein